MKNSIQIRKAVPEDNKEVTAFAFSLMRSVGIKPDPEGIDAALASFGKKSVIPSRDFVAVDGKKPIGSILLRKISPSVVELEGFYIKPDYQCQGIGRKLLHKALSEAREARYESVILTTNKNLTAAIKLYESFGWVRQPEKPDNGADYLYALNVVEGNV